MVGDCFGLDINSLGAVGLRYIAVSAFTRTWDFFRRLWSTDCQHRFSKQLLAFGVNPGGRNVDNSTSVDNPPLKFASFAGTFHMWQRQHIDEDLEVIGVPGCAGLAVLDINLGFSDGDLSSRISTSLSIHILFRGSPVQSRS